MKKTKTNHVSLILYPQLTQKTSTWSISILFYKVRTKYLASEEKITLASNLAQPNSFGVLCWFFLTVFLILFSCVFLATLLASSKDYLTRYFERYLQVVAFIKLVKIKHHII